MSAWIWLLFAATTGFAIHDAFVLVMQLARSTKSSTAYEALPGTAGMLAFWCIVAIATLVLGGAL